MSEEGGGLGFDFIGVFDWLILLTLKLSVVPIFLLNVPNTFSESRSKYVLAFVPTTTLSFL